MEGLTSREGSQATDGGVALNEVDTAGETSVPCLS